MATDAPLISANGLYAAYLQDDANLVLCYTKNGAADLSQPYWSVFANAAARVGGPHAGPHYFATMQPDGNLVLYDGAGKPIWASNTVWVSQQITSGNQLTTGQWMTTDAPLISANGLYAAYLQDDARSEEHTSELQSPC